MLNTSAVVRRSHCRKKMQEDAHTMCCVLVRMDPGCSVVLVLIQHGNVLEGLLRGPSAHSTQLDVSFRSFCFKWGWWAVFSEAYKGLIIKKCLRNKHMVHSAQHLDSLSLCSRLSWVENDKFPFSSIASLNRLHTRCCVIKKTVEVVGDGERGLAEGLAQACNEFS